MKAKKMISMILIGTASLSLLAGCGSESDDSTEEGIQNVSQEEKDTADADDSAEAAEVTAEGGKTLVVYYSASGNTEQAANVIAETTGGELFELEPVEPYTDEDLDWTDDNSRVTREHENSDQREVELVSTMAEDWQNVSVVYIGYPVWWGEAAWPVNGFVKANDFTGKTVIPFCTSASSGLGESGRLLAQMAGTGDWKEGMRFPSSVSKEEVQAWVESLN